MAQVLEMLHLADQDGVPQVQVGGGGIEAHLDQQRFFRLQRTGELLLQVPFADDLQGPFPEQVELFGNGGEMHPI